MNRRTFLAELKVRLSGRFPRSEAKDIIADYQEYFDAGIADGRSEQELCERFGSTQEIVRNLMEQRNANSPALDLDGSWPCRRPKLLISVIILLPVLIALSVVVSEELFLYTLPEFRGVYELALFAVLAGPLFVMRAGWQAPERHWGGFRSTKRAVWGINCLLLTVNLGIHFIAALKVFQEFARDDASIFTATELRMILRSCFIGTVRLDGVMLVVLTASLLLVSVSWWLYLHGSPDCPARVISFVYAGAQWTLALMLMQLYAGSVLVYSYPVMLLESSIPMLFGVLYWALSRQTAKKETAIEERMEISGKLSGRRTVFITATILVMLLLQQSWQLVPNVNDILLTFLTLIAVPGLLALTARDGGSPVFTRLTQGIYRLLNICAGTLVLIDAPAMIYIFFIFQRYHPDWETSLAFAVQLQAYWFAGRLASLIFLAWWLHAMRGGNGAVQRAAHFLYAGAALFVSLMAWLRLSLDDPDMVWYLIFLYIRLLAVGAALAFIVWCVLALWERRMRAYG